MTLMYVSETLIGMARIMKGVLLLSLLRRFSSNQRHVCIRS